jgi:hypothetical protein
LSDAPLFSELSYDELSVGQGWGPFVEHLDQATSDALRGEVGVAEPGDTAPLGVLPLLTLRVLRRALHGIIPGGVLLRQHIAAVDVLPAAGDVEVDVWVSGQERRASGSLSTTFTFALRAGGRVPAVVEWTILAPRKTEAAA